MQASISSFPPLFGEAPMATCGSHATSLIHPRLTLSSLTPSWGKCASLAKINFSLREPRELLLFHAFPPELSFSYGCSTVFSPHIRDGEWISIWCHYHHFSPKAGHSLLYQVNADLYKTSEGVKRFSPQWRLIRLLSLWMQLCFSSCSN